MSRAQAWCNWTCLHMNTWTLLIKKIPFFLFFFSFPKIFFSHLHKAFLSICHCLICRRLKFYWNWIFWTYDLTLKAFRVAVVHRANLCRILLKPVILEIRYKFIFLEETYKKIIHVSSILPAFFRLKVLTFINSL